MLGKNLRALRRQKGISLFKVALATGITDRYLQRVEVGKHTNPTLAVLEKLATFFNVSIDELVGRKTPARSKAQSPRVMLPLEQRVLGKKQS